MSSSLVNSWMVEKHGNRSGGVLHDDGDDPGLYHDHEAENLEISMPSKFTEADRARIASEGPKKYSRDEHRKLKALEEARKMGTAPAEVDEDGYEINPHIPHYVKNVPWYFDKDKKASLRHQRNKNERWTDGMNNWYARGEEAHMKGKQKKRWQKGACQNCGALTHKKAMCLERPRKIGAKFNNKNLAADDYIQPDLDLGFEGKRDRWNGYDPEMHAQIYDKYRKVELAKKALKLEKLETRLKEGEVMSTEQIEDELMKDDDKYTDHDQDHALNIVPKEGKMQPQSDTQARHVVRNLRIREDVAKYLRNLDTNSAYYDPKTRSMRDNPTPGKDTDYKGDNFIRQTGEAADIVNQQMFVWEANRKGVDLHLYADPTRVYLMKDQVAKRKSDIRTKHKSAVLDRYGGEEHLNKPSNELMLGQTVNYKEFTREGRVKNATEQEEQNKPKTNTTSRYEEDIHVNNHTAIWGSYWKDFRWGYACCHSFMKSSYCLGAAGKETTEKADIAKLEHLEKVQKQKAEEEAWSSGDDDASSSSGSSSGSSSSSSSSSSGSSSSSSSSSSSDSDDEDAKAKRKRRRKKKGKKDDSEEKADEPEFESKEDMDQLQLCAAPLSVFRRPANEAPEQNDRRRGYFSGRGGEKSSMPSDKDMEKYHNTKLQRSDPMSSFIASDRARKAAEEKAKHGH